MKIIPVYQPSLKGNEKKYVNQCLDTSWISSKGDFVDQFESRFAEYVGVSYAATVSNGTVALHLALMALEIGELDEVIVPTFTYIASVNAIAYTGAKPIFVDCDLETWQVSIADIKKKITEKTKAIMVVHLYGHPCEMKEIVELANKYNIKIIEDCAEAFGSKYYGNHVGTFGDIATFSFYGNKTITTGEGGMVVTNNKELFDKAIHLRGQGLAKDRTYWHDTIGYNYRMTNICAAIGLAQIEQADQFIAKKIILANWYRNLLEDTPIVFHQETENTIHSYWMCSILVPEAGQRDELRSFLETAGIETRPLFFPIHTMPMYLEANIKYENSEHISARGLNLPSWPELSKTQVEFICRKIKEFFATK